MNNKKTIHVSGMGSVELIAPGVKYQSPVIVEKSVVTRLAGLLQEVPFEAIRDRFANSLTNATTMKAYVSMLEDELAFHRTINALLEVAEKDMKSAGRIDLDNESSQASQETNEHLEQS